MRDKALYDSSEDVVACLLGAKIMKFTARTKSDFDYDTYSHRIVNK